MLRLRPVDERVEALPYCIAPPEPSLSRSKCANVRHAFSRHRSVAEMLNRAIRVYKNCPSPQRQRFLMIDEETLNMSRYASNDGAKGSFKTT